MMMMMAVMAWSIDAVVVGSWNDDREQRRRGRGVIDFSRTAKRKMI
jgi:hypothetical protein